MNDAALAIMAKIRMLYERGEEQKRFLAFHPFAHPLTKGDLAFTDPNSDLASPQELKRAAADFATFVNLIPTVDPVWMYDGRMLWNEYGTIFRLASVADDQLSSEEEATLEAAHDVLYEEREVTDPDTGKTNTELVETEKHERYRQYKKKHQDAKERYNQAVITAENAEDADVKEAAAAEQDELEEAVEEALREWKGKGHKNEIEEAFADIDRLSGRGPKLLWQDWKEQYDRGGPESDVLIDRTFYPTSYWPTSFYRDEATGSWTTVTMDGSEVRSLANRAKADMPDLTDSGLVDDGGQADLEIERLSVELARVEIVRPWFDPSLLRSRVWRWRHGREPLSDGGDPPRGSLPAYTTSMVFARNLTIELEPRSEPNERAVNRLKDGDLVSFGPMLLKQVHSTVESGQVSRLETATFDPEETKALRELTSEVAVARAAPARGPQLARATASPQMARMTVEVEHGDVLARNTALANLASGIAGSNVRANPIARSADHVGQVERLPFRAALDIHPARPAERGASESRPARPAERSASEPRPARHARPARARPRRSGADEDDNRRSERDRTSVPASRGSRSRDPRTRGAVVRDHRDGGRVVRDHRTNRPPIVIEPGDIELPDRPRPSTTGFKGHVREQGDDGKPGSPIEDAQITFDKDGSSFKRTVKTDENGAYRANVPPGRYLASVHRFGYRDYPSSSPDPWAGVVVLSGDGFQDFDVTLEIDPTEQTQVEAWETMQLIAFMCETVPKSPNPDEELAWS